MIFYLYGIQFASKMNKKTKDNNNQEIHAKETKGGFQRLALSKDDINTLRDFIKVVKGGGGGYNNGMEARLNSLEDKVEAMTDKVVDNKVLLAKIDEKLNHIPTTLQLVISMFAVFGVSSGLILGVLSLF